MSETVEREETVPETENSHPTNNGTETTVARDARQPPTIPNEMTGTQLSDDPFLGAGVCQTEPQSLSSPLNLRDYVSSSVLQERTVTETCLTHTAAVQDVSLDLPLTQQTGGIDSDVSFSENPGWRREDGSLFSMNPLNPYVYRCPSGLPTASRIPLPTTSIAGSAGLNMMNGCLPQGTIPPDVSRSGQNGTCSVCTSQGWQRRGFGRREDLYRLSQNPWGPNTVFGPRSVQTDVHSSQIRNGERFCEPDCAFLSDGTLPYHLARKDEQPFSMYSKYRGHHGIVRRVRKKLVAVGGRLCQSFLVWVLFVATLAGVEGFKERSGTLKGLGGVEAEWTDSEAESENESQAKIDVRSFKG